MLPPPPAPLDTLRVNQLDAHSLDSEIGTLLRQQLADVSVYGSSATMQRLQPELDALLKGVIWRYSVCIDAPTPGGRLQNVVYSRADARGISQKVLSRRQKAALLVFNIVLPWLLVRLRGLTQALEGEEAADEDGSGAPRAGGAGARWRRPLRAAARWYLRRAEPLAGRVYAVCAALNFFLFLRSGVFSTLPDRLAGVRMVHIDPTAHRQVALQYMNRVMIWNGLSEFLTTAMPLVNLARLRQTLKRRLLPKSMLRSMEAGAQAVCGFCGTSSMTLAVRSDCGHSFCYFCLASEQMENPKNVPCPHCGSRIETFTYAA